MAGIAQLYQPLLVALVVSLLISAVGKAVGPRLGMVDVPDGDELKVHARIAVPLGGVGILFGLHLGLLAADILLPGFVLASLLIFLVGLIDDVRGVAPMLRLLAALASGVILVGFGGEFTGWLAGTVGVLIVVAAINAVNLLDGLDALAGSVLATSFVGLAILAADQGRESIATMSILAVAAVIGFLFWNLPPAGLFLGNNGAYLMGLTVAWLALDLAHDWASGAVAIAAIGLPFLDLGATVVRRLRGGAALFSGDRDHSYDRLHKRGWSQGRVALTFALAQAAWSALIVTTAIVFGDAAAIALALSLGLPLVLATGLASGETVAPSD